MNKRLLVLIVTLLIILSAVIALLTGCRNQNTKDNESEASQQQEQQESYVPVEASQVVRKTIANTTTISGRVLADKDVMVLPQIPGTVKSIAVKEGDYVKKGDVLFTLDEKEIRKQVDQAKAAYDMAKASFAMNQEQIGVAKESLQRIQELAETTLGKLRENVENLRELYNAGAVSKSQLEEAELALKQQEAQFQAQIDQAKIGASDKTLELAEEQLKQAELAYNQAQDALKNATITAPIDGIVTGITIQEGGIAANTQPAMSIVDMNRVYVSIQVSEGVVGKLTQGQEVNVTIPAVSSEPIRAAIETISPTVNQMTQLYPIKIYLENPEGKIKPGMFANVEIDLDVRENTLVVPGEAVIVKNGKNIVYVIEGDKAIEREVQLGLDIGSEVEILKGLKENETVIVSGQHFVENQGTVKVVGGTEK